MKNGRDAARIVYAPKARCFNLQPEASALGNRCIQPSPALKAGFIPMSRGSITRRLLTNKDESLFRYANVLGLRKES
jgi:hypothetical protein